MALIRIALINDYEVVVKGLAAMLSGYRDTFEIVELDAGTEPRRQADIALYDTFAATPGDRDDVKVLAGNPGVGKLVVYAWDLGERLVADALANGAAGYISKGLPAHELVAALLAIRDGERRVHPVPPGAPTAVIGDWPGRHEGLTPREAEMLALITQGLSNAEIADRTRLSINSVKSYIRSCYRRIGVTNRSHAILWGIEHGFRPDHTRIQR
ncbi:response regulator transcription factor [Gryllotalpicola protaetiae]|uniref:DNA-binding response regulator n=1 Tax=Gryllotalpicola protaetiae TaxID=2419771 RepID=A0A387BHS0_9MICO|nr:response regulator transcription factor [Gryllotalpicola protaetiae]AYG03575.1 DNA-binding response regulator [Gryllotalpicola protaetiae]